MRSSSRCSRLLVLALALSAASFAFVESNPNEGIKEFKERLSKYSEECHTKTKSNYAATMDMFYQGKDYPAGRCFVGCVMQKFGLMDKRGEIQEAQIREAVTEIPSEHAREVGEQHLEECLQKARRDRGDCKRAFLFADCFFQHARQKKNGSDKS